MNIPRLLTVLVATIAALLVWAVAAPLAGVALTVDSGEVVTAGSVIAAALVAGLAGWGLLAVLERTTARSRVVWTWIAGIFLLLSLAGPITLATTGTATAVLASMHLATGAVLITLLPRRRAA